MKRLLMTTAALALLTTTAQAAQIWVNPAKDHGHVIHIKGDIEKGDANQFANVVGHAGVKPNDATVYLDSPGGYVMEGVPIARAIKKYGWNTYVAKDTTCVSMCAVIWLAGHKRFVNQDGQVGFHSATDAKRGHGKRSDVGNAMMFSFYHELGISDKAARVFLAAEPGDDAIWLTDALAKSLDIAAVTIPADEEKHEQPKAQDKPPLDKTANDPIGTKLADASPTPELPARDAGDAGPPPVKPADLAPVKPSDLVATPSKQPRHEQPQRRERPQRRHYAGGGYGGRVCGFSVPVPYIGGITIRGRC